MSLSKIPVGTIFFSTDIWEIYDAERRISHIVYLKGQKAKICLYCGIRQGKKGKPAGSNITAGDEYKGANNKTS